MSEPDTGGHVHECDEYEHHGDEPEHIHGPRECDEHEHHADEGDEKVAAAE